MKWYQKAAEQNDGDAQMILGYSYAGGLGVKQNLATAKKWFGMACDNKIQEGCDTYRELNQGAK